MSKAEQISGWCMLLTAHDFRFLGLLAFAAIAGAVVYNAIAQTIYGH